MADILVAYYSRSGNTQSMAKVIADEIINCGLTCDLRDVKDVEIPELLSYKAMIVGSPAYYGLPAAEIIKFFDESVGLHGRLEGMVGSAFSSAGNIGGGAETTCLSILQMMMVHGMIVTGSARGGHYGPVSIGEPDEMAIKHCRNQARRVVDTVKIMMK